MRPSQTILAVAALFALSACAPTGQASDSPSGMKSGAKTAMNDCPVIDSGDWHAWVDPPRDGREGVLRVHGRVDLPTPGYAMSWSVGPTDRAMPPGQRLRIDFTPPDGMVIQVVTPTEVAFSTATPFREYRDVIVSCGDTVLHSFGPVTPLE